MPDAIGWISSMILLGTLGQQIFKQWHDETSRGVSAWLFVGQTLASLGFTTYSLLLHNWVFVVTNSALLLAGVTGMLITWRHRRRSSLPGRAQGLRAVGLATGSLDANWTQPEVQCSAATNQLQEHQRSD